MVDLLFQDGTEATIVGWSGWIVWVDGEARRAPTLARSGLSASSWHSSYPRAWGRRGQCLPERRRGSTHRPISPSATRREIKKDRVNEAGIGGRKEDQLTQSKCKHFTISSRICCNALGPCGQPWEYLRIAVVAIVYSC